jgi:hypothetical protein
VRQRSIVGPVVLIVLGVVFLLSNLGWIPRIGQLLITWWPAILIVVGVSMLIERAWWAPSKKDDPRKPGGREFDE